jgi:large subunit ribosomal protein L30
MVATEAVTRAVPDTQQPYRLMAKLKITQTRSSNRRPQPQRRTLEALGLRRIRHSVTHDDTPQIRGMINKVQHLVQVEELS